MFVCPAARASLQLLKKAESPPLPLEAAIAGAAPMARVIPAATSVQVTAKGRVMGPPTTLADWSGVPHSSPDVAPNVRIHRNLPRRKTVECVFQRGRRRQTA